MPPSGSPGVPLVRLSSIAVGITVTQDPASDSVGFLDGAAVLAHSLALTQSRHHLSLLSLVHPNITVARPKLSALGYRVVEFHLPVSSDEIRPGFLRDHIDKSGCCGAAELLKLCAFRLLEYDRVLMVDTDALFRRNIDALIDRSLTRGLSLMYTPDVAMTATGTPAPLAQGGFLLLQPDRKVSAAEDEKCTRLQPVRARPFRQKTFPFLRPIGI